MCAGEGGGGSWVGADEGEAGQGVAGNDLTDLAASEHVLPREMVSSSVSNSSKHLGVSTGLQSLLDLGRLDSFLLNRVLSMKLSIKPNRSQVQ